VNGIRALEKKLDGGIASFFAVHNVDVICFQETKVSSVREIPDELLHIEGYESFWNFSKRRKGYSGVCTYCKEGLVINAETGLKFKSDNQSTPKLPSYVQLDEEGRIIMTDLGSVCSTVCNQPG